MQSIAKNVVGGAVKRVDAKFDDMMLFKINVKACCIYAVGTLSFSFSISDEKLEKDHLVNL